MEGVGSMDTLIAGKPLVMWILYIAVAVGATFLSREALCWLLRVRRIMAVLEEIRDRLPEGRNDIIDIDPMFTGPKKDGGT